MCSHQGKVVTVAHALTVQAIQHNHHHIATFAGSCLTDTLEHWLSCTTPQPKWNDVTGALRSNAIQRGDIAEIIEGLIEGGLSGTIV